MADDILPEGIDALLGSLARALLNQAAALEARLVAEGRANLLTLSDGYHLALRVPEPLYRRLSRARQSATETPGPKSETGVRASEERIRRCAQKLLEPLMTEKVKPVKVSFTMMLAPPSNWRESTKALLRSSDPLGHRPHKAGSEAPQREKYTTTEQFNIGIDSPGYDPHKRNR